MISDELKSIVEKLSSQGKMAFVEGATKDQITLFEKQNNIKFPEEFEEWLLYSDGGEFFLPAGIQLYGVAHKPLIDIKYSDRPNDNYIVIGALSNGDPILCESKAKRISIYNHESGKIEGDETYPDFFTFLRDLYDILGIGD